MTASRAVVIGADTHLDTVHLAALSPTGASVADAQFPTHPAGYHLAVKWAQSFGAVLRAGVEGTSSYGSGLTRALQDARIEVAEINRSDRAGRRRQGKSDPLDAYAAARAALAAPAELRERYRRHTTTTLIRALARCRPAAYDDSTTVAMLIGCKALAQRIAFLEDQGRTLTAELDRLVTAINPGLRAAYGVGPDTAAQLIITAGTHPHRLHNEAAFAMFCGTAPIPASSGTTNRHRLSCGGDRAANNALHRIALVRMSSDERTRADVTAQLARGRSKLDILRLLKRAVAREAFRLLTQPCAVDDYSDLRPSRQAKNITLSLVADHFGVWPNDISRLERGLKRDDTLAANYRLWLSAA